MPASLHPSPSPGPRPLGNGWRGEIDAAYDSPAMAAWLAALTERTHAADARLIYRLRNRIYRVPNPVPGRAAELCVKAFKRPPLFRSLFYSFTRSKAARSFLNSEHLLARGVGVPRPVAYVERWRGRVLVESAFLTEFLPDISDLYTETVRLLRDDPDAAKYIALLGTVAREIRRMHDGGFAHQDLGGQNITLRRTGDSAWSDVAFIDLNRGRIRPAVSTAARARDLAQLEIPSHFRRIFFHQYFGDGPIPRDFARWEAAYRARITLHNESRKFRHPIRHYIESRKHIVIASASPAYRDTWLWDEKSGQPSVVLESRERRRHRAKSDLLRVAWHNLRRTPALRRRYAALRAEAYARPVDFAGRFGCAVEVGPDFDGQLALLAATPGLPVFVRCYFHKGDAGLEACAAAVGRLAAAGHEVSLGLIQSRAAVLEPAAWHRFLEQALDRLHPHVRFVEIAHAVNRVKWGQWSLAETVALWESVAALRRRHPALTILGPAVNDFEYHYFPPLLARLGGLVDGLSCHLYVDRRGAPENFQGRFSLLEKCVLGRAMAEIHGVRGFYVTETNWPVRGAGDYSPIAGAYTPRHYVESDLHVDDDTYAAYLVRYALIALGSGMTERVWWWRLAARGYGLVDDVGGLRPRTGWHALVHFHRTLGAARFLRREERDGAVWWHFDRATVVYALQPASVARPGGFTRATTLTGQPLAPAADGTLPVSGSPVYLEP